MANIPNLVRSIGSKISTTLSSGITDTDLTLHVTSGTGLNTGGGYLILDKGLSTEEIVYAESVSSTTITIATNGRGCDGTSAVAHNTGATVMDVISKNYIEGPRTAFIVGHNDDGTHKTTSFIDLIYPVGSIYISIVSTNPNTLFGRGTWVAFATGRTIVGIDAGQAEFDLVEETGGEKTHTLTESEMPVHTHIQNAHNHQLYAASNQYASGTNAEVGRGGSLTAEVTASTTATNQNAGSGAAHNNLQPYIVVYMWKRTA